MSKLTEIEKNYAEELIKFFCEEYTKMFGDKFTIIRHKLDEQITKRLYDKNLIIDWMVRIENLDISKVRDIKLSRILETGKKEVINEIVVDFRLNKFTEPFQVRHSITIEDLSK